MSIFDALRYRWKVLTRPRDHEADLAEDMEFFVDAATRDAQAAPDRVAPPDARRTANRRFGNRTYYKEESRHAAGLVMLDVIAQDARFALRTFARTPGFTAIVIATLAIGIGANTAIFSAVDTLLLTPLPFRQPDRLMNVTLTIPTTAAQPGRADIVWSYPKVELFRGEQRVFSELTAWTDVQSTVQIGDDALRISGEFIDQHYFATLGIAPALGRAFLPTENRVGGPAVAVISDELWRSAFNADPAVLGRQVRVDLAMVTIVGVAPPRFAGVSGQARFWVPFLSAPSVWDSPYFTDPYRHTFHLIGRLLPGVTPERAAALSRAIGPRVDAQFPERGPNPRHWGVEARTLDATRVDEDGRRSVILLFGAVAMVLLVACANVANLFLVRAAGRRREMGIRLAIGASRGRLVRQLLVESTLLGVLGGMASVIVAAIGVKVIGAMRPALWGSESSSGIGTVFTDPIHLNLTALGFTGVIAILTGVLFGLAPALKSTRLELTDSLKTDSAGAARKSISTRFSARDALTSFEIALAIVLLAASGVLTRSLMHLTAIRPGFDPAGVLTMRVNRAANWSRDSISRFYDVALERLGSLPGVKRAAIADCAPQGGACAGMGVHVLGGADETREIGSGVHWITPGWNEVLGVPLLEGRLLQPSDRVGAPRVALVSQEAARTFWPNADPLGRRVVIDRDTVAIVGVIGDVRFYGLAAPPRPEIFISYYQFPLSFRMMLHLRTDGDPAALAESVRRALREVAPGFPVYDVATLDSRIGNALAESRFLAQLLSVFAGLALLLATIGVYGVISYTTTQRAREMGIRVALGATRADVIGLVVRHGAMLAAFAAPVGLAGALLGTRLIRAKLYDVTPTDPVTLAGIVSVLVVAVLVACWGPARRAASVPAVEALRGG